MTEFEPGAFTRTEDAGPLAGASTGQLPNEYHVPGTPKSEASALETEFIVVYDTQEKPLLVSVRDPEKVAVLSEAPDWFVERHRLNKREFVSSPQLGLMMYATGFLQSSLGGRGVRGYHVYSVLG